MTIIALVGNKGGAGKTTLTVNFAAGLERYGSVAILDADQQRSSLQWRAMSTRNNALPVFDAVDGLTFKARQQANQYDYLLIDCPPSVEAVQTQEALRLSDLALIPVQPSPLDLWATVHIEREVELAREKNPNLIALLLINQLEPRTRLSQIVRQGLEELGLPTAETAIRRRVAYRASALEGKSVHDMGSRGKDASEEIYQLINEVIANERN